MVSDSAVRGCWPKKYSAAPHRDRKALRWAKMIAKEQTVVGHLDQRRKCPKILTLYKDRYLARSRHYRRIYKYGDIGQNCGIAETCVLVTAKSPEGQPGYCEYVLPELNLS